METTNGYEEPAFDVAADQQVDRKAFDDDLPF